jgi:ribosomal protein L7/L12
MQDEIEIRCPKCHSSYIKVNLEQNDKLRLAIDCQLCGHHFSTSNHYKVNDLKLKTDSVSINISIDKPKMSDEELDAKIIQLYKDIEILRAIELYKEHKNVSLIEASNYVDNLTQFIEEKPFVKSESQIFEEELIELVRQGERYKAIQIFQEKQGCSRQDAKLYIDHIVEFHSDIKKPGCMFWFIIVMLLGLIINFFQWVFG